MNKRRAIGINSAHFSATMPRYLFMECRLGCGACCIAPSISSAIPGMPMGKAAGEPCIQLDANNLCKLFGKPERPQVCADFGAEEWVCGTSDTQALMIISDLEITTQ